VIRSRQRGITAAELAAHRPAPGPHQGIGFADDSVGGPGIVGSLGAAFSMGDPKLTALYARIAALEEALAHGQAEVYLPGRHLGEPLASAD
jgi:hypothetical protein